MEIHVCKQGVKSIGTNSSRILSSSWSRSTKDAIQLIGSLYHRRIQAAPCDRRCAYSNLLDGVRESSDDQLSY